MFGKKVNVSDYWLEKEIQLKEKVIHKAFACYEGGHPDYPDKSQGLLFLTYGGLYYENFEKKTILSNQQKGFKKVLIGILLNDISDFFLSEPEKSTIKNIFNIFKNLEPAKLTISINDNQDKIVFSNIIPHEEWDLRLKNAKLYSNKN